MSIIGLLLILAGCEGSRNIKKEDTAPLVNLNATPTPTATQDLSQALPTETVVESFGSLPKNDLINGFYYYADGQQPSELEFSKASSENNRLRVRVAVQGDKACYLATGLSGTDFEMESLVRESDGVWRGLHSKRYFTQPTLNSLVMYGGETDRIASFVNKSIEGDDIRVVQASLAARAIKVENIIRLTLPHNVELIYRGQCLNFQPIYFRGKLAKIESSSQSQISKIENDILQVQTPIVIPTPTVTPTVIPTVIPTVTQIPTPTKIPKR
ncbi:hypothetical protein NIES4071_103750 (plasmid) [Calothrix sp. NIES-4071]|nr:hypothetical protein NIES4071_103750 [Calothrix sp. NIES-4071]BAZ64362.1 hypothetical protein NIES4105_100950 [Calothrix sp. NIES-4105]